MELMIYLIGGVPRAGKSALARRLVERNGVPSVSTDVLLHMVSDTLPELSLTKPHDEIRHRFSPYVANFVKHADGSIAHYAIEGDAFTPALVASLQKKHPIRSCFLGLSRVTLQEIQDHVGENDWLGDLSESELQDLPQWIMEKSRAIQEECEMHGIRYFDMADGEYEQNLEEAYLYLIDWMHPG